MADQLQVKVDPNDEQGHYSNAISIHRNKNEVVIDFGYVLPGSNPPVIKVVSRVNLNRENAEAFAKSLSDTLQKGQPAQQDQQAQ